MSLKIGVDLDEVVYPFVSVFRRWLVEERGIRTAEECPFPTHWGFFKEWGMTTDTFMEEFVAGIHAGYIFHTGEPIPGSIEGLHQLAERGHELIFITARHIPGAESEARRATLKWLASCDIALSGLCISDDKGALQTDIFLEDAEHNYDSLEADGETMPVLLTQRWNRGHPGRRVDSWDQFCEFVEMAHTFMGASADDSDGGVDLLDRQDIVREAFGVWSNPYTMQP